MSGITVTFGSIQQAQGDVAATVSRVDGQLNDLKSFLAPLISSWEGSASSNYQALQKKWDTSATAMNTVLQQISQMLGQVHDSYQQTESANRGMWG
jgi:6 kDa early secretory antigenic target